MAPAFLAERDILKQAVASLAIEARDVRLHRKDSGMPIAHGQPNRTASPANALRFTMHAHAHLQ